MKDVVVAHLSVKKYPRKGFLFRNGWGLVNRTTDFMRTFINTLLKTADKADAIGLQLYFAFEINFLW